MFCGEILGLAVRLAAADGGVLRTWSISPLLMQVYRSGIRNQDTARGSQTFCFRPCHNAGMHLSCIPFTHCTVHVATIWKTLYVKSLNVGVSLYVVLVQVNTQQ